MEHQADVHPQLRLILPDAGPGCEKNGRRATWPVTTRSGRHQVPVAVLPTAKSLSAFSLKPQSDRLLDNNALGAIVPAWAPLRHGPALGAGAEARQDRARTTGASRCGPSENKRIESVRCGARSKLSTGCEHGHPPSSMGNKGKAGAVPGHGPARLTWPEYIKAGVRRIVPAIRGPLNHRKR